MHVDEEGEKEEEEKVNGNSDRYRSSVFLQLENGLLLVIG